MKTAVRAAAVLGIAAAVALVTSRELERPDIRLPAAGTAAAPSARAPTTDTSSTERQRPTAAGGVAIIASSARAQAVVAGVVSKVARIDEHGWRAELRVDRVLLGSIGLGDTITIAWEELSTARRVRFADEQRVLLVLDSLPMQSLWRKRFPARDRTRPILVVASGGDAFLPRPDGVTLDVLEHYLVMGQDARDGAPGAQRLAELVRGGHPAVAREALTLLEGKSARMNVGDDTPLLDADGAASLLAAARSPEREPSLRASALRLAARHRLPGTRETALALTEPASPIRADAFRALAVLPDGLPVERIEALLTDDDPELRVAGVELARDDIGRERIATLAQHDPSPAVRLAAARALLARHLSGGSGDASGGIADVIVLLDDPDAIVRSGVAESIGALGSAAVEQLRAVVETGSERAALAAVLGLSQAGRQGSVTLASIAETHANKSVRTFARLALGKAPGHTH